LSTKIHTMVDALGNPVGFCLSGGQAHDLVGADHLLPDMQAATLIADKAYDADARVLEPLAAAGKVAVIPPKANRREPREIDRELYKVRNSSAPSPRATTRQHATSWPLSTSPPARSCSIDDTP
jgi:transposase